MYPADDIFSDGLSSSTELLKGYRRTLQQSRLPSSHLSIEEHLKLGNVSFRHYPFMQPEYVNRSAELIASLDTRLLESGEPCVIRASNFNSSPTLLHKHLLEWKSLKEFVCHTGPSGNVACSLPQISRKEISYSKTQQPGVQTTCRLSYN